MTDVEGPRVGWIGTGIMGAAMCGHLLDAGCSVRVFTRTRRSAEALLERGAIWCDTPAEVGAAAEVIFSIVGFPRDVRDVILGENGVLAGTAPGSIVVDMTTSEPTLAAEVYEEAKARGVDALDAPVSGGDVGARNRTLVVMVGGSEMAFQRVLPLLNIFGSSIVYAGGAGAGQHMKLMNQITIASGLIGICEALLYAEQAGLEIEKALEAISAGAAGSWSLTNYGPRIIRGDFTPGFRVDHFVKDLGIALGEAARMKLALPGLALAHELYIALTSQGRGQQGTHSLIIALATLNGRRWSSSR